MMKTMSKLAGGALAALLPAAALAHTGDAAVGGFAAGLLHPLGGLDHLLAMVAVGLAAVTLGGRALWSLPLAFAGLLLLGAGLGFAGIDLPLVEPLILASVVTLGLLVAVGLRVSPVATTLLVGLFGLAHGQAHAVELALPAQALPFLFGLLATTALLHLGGILAGHRLALRAGLLRLGGAAIGLAGAALVLG